MTRAKTPPRKIVPLHEPVFAGNEWKYVKDCLDTGWVSSTGAYVDRFERLIAERLGCRRAVAVVNGTAGLHLALLAADVKPGDEVLVPAITFIATANAAVYAGAVPRFVDAEPGSLGMDPGKLEAYLVRGTEAASGGRRDKATGRRVSACVPMHVFGLPALIDDLVRVCAKFGVALIEDAAEALGSSWKGRALGTFGRLGVLSFNGNKVLTTGGGGMVVTDDEALADRVKHLSTQAKKDAHAYLHDAVGFNYRLPNVNAALGCAQLEQLDGFLARKRRTAEQYRAGLAGARGLELLWERDGGRANFWLNTVRCADARAAQAAMRKLAAEGLEARPLWTPCHRQPMFERLTAGPIEAADQAWRTCFNVPSSASLAEKDAARVLRALRA